MKVKIRKFWSAGAGMAMALMFSGQVYAADTVALVSEIAGKVVVKTDGGSSPPKLLGALTLGARIELSEGAKLSLIYVAKGDEYKLSGPGSYQVDAASLQTISGTPPAKQASIGGALNGKKIRSENVAQATLTMRGIKKVRRSIEPLSPSGSVVLADPLQLQWKEPASGLAYQIQLIDSQNQVLVNQEVTGNKLTLSADMQLASDSYYTWSASTTMSDGSLVTASAKFRVASDETRQQAAKIKPGIDGSVSERVAYGLWLENENFAYEARLVWDELASEFPDQPNVRARAALKP